VLPERAHDDLAVADVKLEPMEAGAAVLHQALADRARRGLDPEERDRMSFSRPITSKPSFTKCRTDAEPISPPEPLITAIGDRPEEGGRLNCLFTDQRLSSS
jgi:hypothetical protein